MKLRAFTLIELMTTLIISSITIAFAISVLTIVIKMHNSYKERTNKIGEVEQFIFLINKDIFECKYVESINTGFSCVKDSFEVKYHCTKNHITRQQKMKTDTFDFTNTKLELLPLEQNISYIGVINLKFTTNKERQIDFFLHKQYDAYTKMLKN